MDLITLFLSPIVIIICFAVPYYLVFKRHSIRSTLVSYIPTFCTSTGVFFSFGVLWWVLKDFKLGGDLSEIVRQLSNKFLFSLIGILASIIWSSIIKYRITLEEQIELNEEYMKKNPQQLLWDMVELQENNNELIHDVKERLISDNGLLRNFSHDVNEALMSVRHTIKETTFEQLQKLKDLLGVMTTAGEYMREQLGEMINDLKVSLEAYIKIMGDQTLSLTKEQAKTINDEFVKLTTTLRVYMTEELTKSKELVEAVVKTFGDSIKDNTIAALELQEKIATEFKTTSENQINNLKNSYTNLENTLGIIDANIQEKIGEILKNNTENLSKTFEKIAELQQRAQTALEESSQKFKDAVDQYSNASHSNSAITEQLQKQFTLLEELLENTRQLYDNWRLQEDEMKQMQDRTNAIANMTDKIDRLLHTLQQSANHQ
ncbi:MAG: hypothetical protein IPM47_04795 [Sphingobacteriales bacterium]|nr:MAG: hypothetical protein IPM47_04795 [Sphingobacteriales bacterium]